MAPTGGSITPDPNLPERIFSGKRKKAAKSNKGRIKILPRPDPYFPISKVSDTATFEVFRGDVVTEVHQSFSEIASQVIRLYANEKHVEFEWVAGPMEIERFKYFEFFYDLLPTTTTVSRR